MGISTKTVAIIVGVVAIVCVGAYLAPYVIEERYGNPYDYEGKCYIDDYERRDYYIGESGIHYAESGMDYMVVHYTLKNTDSEEPIPIYDNEMFSKNFEVVVDGVVYGAPYLQDDHPDKTSAKAVAQGGSVDSVVIFKVPESIQKFYIKWVGDSDVMIIPP